MQNQEAMAIGNKNLYDLTSEETDKALWNAKQKGMDMKNWGWGWVQEKAGSEAIPVVELVLVVLPR